jgi:hypothetical protein
LSDNEAIEISLAHPQALTAWEREFAQSLHRGGFTSRLSQKQKTVLHRLARKCAAGGSDA